MKNNLENKIKQWVKSIKSSGLRENLLVILRYGNLKRRALQDFLAIFKDVKLYRKDGRADYEKQWSARLGRFEFDNPYNKFELYRDPQGLKNMRGDDMFIYSILPEGSKVLEVGCGNGRLGYILKQKNINYCGLDISKIAVKEARKLDLEVYVCDLNNLNDPVFEILKTRKFDYVISLGTLQLLTEAEKIIPKLFEFSDVQLHGVWNAGHWSSRLKMLFGRFPIYSYSTNPEGKHIYPYAYGQYQRHWTFKDFKSYSRELGFRAEPIGVGLKFPLKGAGLKKTMLFPSWRSGRVLWKISK